MEMDTQTAMLLTDFHRACVLIARDAPSPYAKQYASAGLHMFDLHCIAGQIPYLQSNLGNWRGACARGVKEDLKRIASEIRGR